MKPAEREFEAWFWEADGGRDIHAEHGGTIAIKAAFLAGRAAGLRAALSEHDRPLVAQQVADGVIKDWEGFYTGTTQ